MATPEVQSSRLETDDRRTGTRRAGAVVGREARHHLADPAVRRGLVVLGVLTGLLAVVMVQVVTETGLVRLDLAAHELGMENRWTTTWVVMKVLEVLGQRGPTAVEAFLVVGWIAWGIRSWRPVVVLTVGLLALNFVVGLLKIVTARGKPYHGDPSVFTEGLMFPSGHAANCVLTWALVGYLIARYAGVRSPRRWLIGTAVVTTAVTLVVGIASVYYDTHWITDLVAGWIVGGMVLQATVLVDQVLDRQIARNTPAPVVHLADHPRSADHGRGTDHPPGTGGTGEIR